MVKQGAYTRNAFLHGNRTRHTLQGDGGEDDGTLDPPFITSVPYAAFPTSSTINRRYAFPLHCALTKLKI